MTINIMILIVMMWGGAGATGKYARMTITSLIWSLYYTQYTPTHNTHTHTHTHNKKGTPVPGVG